MIIKFMHAAALFIAVLVALAAILLLANACTPKPSLTVAGQPALPDADDTLSVTTWNLGYAALGDDADFVADGGESVRASSRSRIEANVHSIKDRLRSSGSEIHLLQEVAGPGFMTRGVNVRAGVREAFADAWTASSADVRTRLLPGPVSLDHGLFVASGLAVEDAEVIEITREPERMAGVIERAYHVQRVRLAGPARWTVINVHLSAFDAGDVRARQLEDVLEIAQREYEARRRVVIGGDFNQRLVDTGFAHTTAEADLFWLRDLPEDAVPAGWTLAADPSAPTVRTLERPFTPGENYTAVIDGFILSPNVELVSVQAGETGFVASDHQPVTVRVRAR